MFQMMEVDLIATMGYQVHESVVLKASIFVDERRFADELVSSDTSR